MRVALTVICVFLSCIAFGQQQNNNWCFGDKAGVDFNGTTPTVFTTTINAAEASATVSHKTTGALLFYTDGVRVWNRNHALMSNGTGIGNDLLSSSLQGAVIVPFVDDSNKYYVFTQEPESLPDGALFYSVVDMSLNGGLGNVVTGKKKIRIGDGFVEGMFAFPTCDGHWLLLSSKTTNEFYSYRISVTGVDTTPVVSKMSFPYIASVLAPIKVSPDGKKLLYTTYSSQPHMGRNFSIIGYYDYNEKTGVVSNGQLIDAVSTSVANYYSCEFSEDGSKAYVCDLRNEVLQFDLSLGNISAIAGSRKTVYKNQGTRKASLLQIGPDNNIYVSIDGTNFIDRISNTNLAFPGCVYTTNAITLAAGTEARKSFPLAVTYPVVKSLDTVFTSTDVQKCSGSITVLNGLTSALKYEWQDNSTNRSFNVRESGTYWVTSTFKCLQQTDTFKVESVRLPLDIGNDTTICKGYPLVANVDIENDSTTYIWQDGSTAKSLTISKPGIYYVVVNSGICVTTDTINVDVNDSAYFEFGNDTILCKGDTYNLHVPEGAKTYTWSTGDTDSFIVISTPGAYGLFVERAGCSYTDTVAVGYADGKLNIGNDTLVCDGEEVILSARTIIDKSTYLWSNGAMVDSITVTEQGVYTVVVTNRCGVFNDTAIVDYKVCDCNPLVPNAFTPNNDGRNDKFGPILRCISATYNFIVINRFGEVVFKTTELDERWDGTYKGQPADVSTYYYMIEIENTSGTTEFFKGDVVLIR